MPPFSAGLGAAGIALLLRAITLKKLPNWIIPVFAGAGMLGFQIYSEYTWFSHQRSLLPAGVEVIRTAQESSGWRPWSYLYPQTLRFVAADINNASVNQRYSALVLVDLYFLNDECMPDAYLKSWIVRPVPAQILAKIYRSLRQKKT
ncbi:hypothetical protein ACT691_00135 [Vibrio metschnikovii]